jgi:hypothetical protein
VRLSPDDVACWLLKTARPPADIAADWRPGTARRLHRCLRRSYRLELMAPGQRCLLWLSGPRQPGVHALGVLTEPPDPTEAAPDAEVELHLLAEPVGRGELLGDPAFTAAEVVRMPAGSNPSWLDAAQLAAVLDRVDPAAARAAGWH